MRRIAALFVTLIACLASVSASAESVGIAVCPFLVRDDLSMLGVDKNTSFADSDWDWKQTPSETPNAQVISNMCMVKINTPAGRVEVMLALDSFKGKVTEEQVGQWLKAKGDPEEGVTLITVGDSVCETGSYDLPSEASDGGIANVNQIYVACDKQVGTRHLALNIHVPEASKGILPSPEQTKAILDKSVQLLNASKSGQSI